MLSYYENALKKLQEASEYRECLPLSSAQDVHVQLKDKELLLLGSNNYLSLNKHPAINEAAEQAIHFWGTGSGGSRLTTGTNDCHVRLETTITQFKQTEATLLFSSGYAANVGVMSALADKDFTIFSDRLNHASIVDGIALSGAKWFRYRNVDDLADRLVNCTSKYKLVVTDSVFSMDGTIAPIRELQTLCELHDALLIVDDAHGVGVLGKKGKGISEYLNLEKPLPLVVGTLSKAIPSSGGYVTGNKILIDYIRNKARSFLFSTATTPSSAAAACKAFEIIESEGWRRVQLHDNIRHFVQALNDNGFEVPQSETPIIPIIIGDSPTTMALQQRLLAAGIYIPGIRPPTVPKGTSRLRASVNVNHTKEQLSWVAAVLKTEYEKCREGGLSHAHSFY